jgi:hypothetical protein
VRQFPSLSQPYQHLAPLTPLQCSEGKKGSTSKRAAVTRVVIGMPLAIMTEADALSEKEKEDRNSKSYYFTLIAFVIWLFLRFESDVMKYSFVVLVVLDCRYIYKSVWN